MPLCASTGPVLAHSGMFTGKWLVHLTDTTGIVHTCVCDYAASLWCMHVLVSQETPNQQPSSPTLKWNRLRLKISASDVESKSVWLVSEADCEGRLVIVRPVSMQGREDLSLPVANIHCGRTAWRGSDLSNPSTNHTLHYCYQKQLEANLALSCFWNQWWFPLNQWWFH